MRPGQQQNLAAQFIAELDPGRVYGRGRTMGGGGQSTRFPQSSIVFPWCRRHSLRFLSGLRGQVEVMLADRSWRRPPSGSNVESTRVSWVVPIASVSWRDAPLADTCTSDRLRKARRMHTLTGLPQDSRHSHQGI